MHFKTVLAELRTREQFCYSVLAPHGNKRNQFVKCTLRNVVYWHSARLRTNQHLQAQIPLCWAVDFWFIGLKMCSLIPSSPRQMDIFVILMLTEILMRPYWDPANVAAINAHCNNPLSQSSLLQRGSHIMLLCFTTIKLVGRTKIFLLSLFGRIFSARALSGVRKPGKMFNREIFTWWNKRRETLRESRHWPWRRNSAMAFFHGAVVKLVPNVLLFKYKMPIGNNGFSFLWKLHSCIFKNWTNYPSSLKSLFTKVPWRYKVIFFSRVNEPNYWGELIHVLYTYRQRLIIDYIKGLIIACIFSR